MTCSKLLYIVMSVLPHVLSRGLSSALRPGQGRPIRVQSQPISDVNGADKLPSGISQTTAATTVIVAKQMRSEAKLASTTDSPVHLNLHLLRRRESGLILGFFSPQPGLRVGHGLASNPGA